MWKNVEGLFVFRKWKAMWQGNGNFDGSQWTSPNILRTKYPWKTLIGLASKRIKVKDITVSVIVYSRGQGIPKAFRFLWRSSDLSFPSCPLCLLFFSSFFQTTISRFPKYRAKVDFFIFSHERLSKTWKKERKTNKLETHDSKIILKIGKEVSAPPPPSHPNEQDEKTFEFLLIIFCYFMFFFFGFQEFLHTWIIWPQSQDARFSTFSSVGSRDSNIVDTTLPVWLFELFYTKKNHHFRFITNFSYLADRIWWNFWLVNRMV